MHAYFRNHQLYLAERSEWLDRHVTKTSKRALMKIESWKLIAQSGDEDNQLKLVEKLVKAADTMRDSGNLYLTWAKHYAALAEGNTDASSDEDETEDFDV